jgi:cytochrome c-type biogenesis protein CcmF
MILDCCHYLFFFILFLSVLFTQICILTLVPMYALLLTMCFLNAIGCFMCSNFSLYNVLTHSTAKAPLFYQIATTWSNHEGSLLLWCWLLAILGLLSCFLPRFLWNERIVANLAFQNNKKKSQIFEGYDRGTLIPIWIHEWCGAVSLQLARRGAEPLDAWRGFSWIRYYYMISVFFGFFLVCTSNPFLKNQWLSFESIAELNPVLQDPILAIHPPCIYLGYVASAICFSFSFGLIQIRNKSLWNDSWHFLRFWVCACWSALTIGILLGSWWAYHELGWGGWWFWDPVENASLMPWLFATGCIHAVLLPRLNLWSLFFNLFTFVLSILGTFFVRSGLLASVHSFATDSTRGLVLLALFITILVLSIHGIFREIRRLRLVKVLNY